MLIWYPPGKIAEALMANATTLFTPGPEINGHTVLSSKVVKGDVKVGLRVLAEAKPEKAEEVKAFLTVTVLHSPIVSHPLIIDYLSSRVLLSS